jgi:transcription antitermination factor NusG
MPNSLQIQIKENDQVRMLDGCYKGQIGIVRAVRPENHYPYLVVLPNQELIPCYGEQIEKV